MKLLKLMNLNIIILSLWLTPVMSSYAQSGNSNITVFQNDSGQGDSIGDGRLQYRGEQLEKNQAYQAKDNPNDSFMQNSSCNQTRNGSVDDDFLPTALETNRLTREGELLNRFDDCLFNKMTGSDKFLAQRTQELNDTLGPIGEFSGFGASLNGQGFNAEAYDRLRAERDTLINDLNRSRNQNAACFPTNSTNPEFCDIDNRRAEILAQISSNQGTPQLPAGCNDVTSYELIKTKSQRLKMIEGDLLSLEEQKRISEAIANGPDNENGDTRNNLNNGANHLDYMENWEKAKDRLRRAEIDEPIKEQAYQSAYNNCWEDPPGHFRTTTCQQDVNEKYAAWQMAINEITLAQQEVQMWFGRMASGQTDAEAAASEADSRDGGAKAGVTLDAINRNAGAYGPFLDDISDQIAKTNNLYNQALANLEDVQSKLQNRKEYSDDFKTYDLMRADYGDDTVQSARDLQLLISDLGLMATSSSGAQTVRCREIGYNKDTKQIDFRPNCPTNGAGTPLPTDLSARMANPNATFKQCYVRSFDLFRAASAMYLAAEINAKENMNNVANECLMECVAITNTVKLALHNIDPTKREPNCMVRENQADPTSEVPGIYVNDENGQDDKNEQMAALERAANLYGNMVSMAQLKASNKQQALDMYNVAYQAAMEEMTAKVQRVSTAQANLDAARAALKATNMALNLIIAAIAGYTAYKVAQSSMCGPQNAGACAEAARMVGVIAAAVVFMMQMQTQKQGAQNEVAYWMEELKDAQLHGHMACNYPGINKNYQMLSEATLTNEPTRAAIGVARNGTALTNVTLGDADLNGALAPIFNAQGECIRYCDGLAGTDIYIPPESDLYNAINGNPDMQWAVDRSGQLNNDVAEFDIFGNCIRYCDNLNTTIPTTWVNPALLENPDMDIFKLQNPNQYQELNFEKYTQKTNSEIMLQQIQKMGVTGFLKYLLPSEAQAQSNITIIDNDGIDLTDANKTSNTDKALGKSMGMSGLNETTDFSYFLAMKIEALKMQTLDNTTTVNLQQNPVAVDHLVEWNGSDCNDDVYNTNQEDNTAGGNGSANGGAPSTTEVNNRNQTIGCGPEMHLEDFANYNERNTSTFETVPYRNELPEKTGFPLPETRHVYVMSVIRAIQKNMLLHAYRLGDCFSGGTNSAGERTLNSAGSGANSSPTSICGQANRYAQLVRYARRQMGLGDTGLDEVAIDPNLRSNGVCLKFSDMGNPIPDAACECRLNGSCVQYQNPVFGNFSNNLSSSGSLAIRAANDTLNGNLEGANVAAGELNAQSNAIRRSLRDTKKQFQDAAFGSNVKAANNFFKTNPTLNPGETSGGVADTSDLKNASTSNGRRNNRYGQANGQGGANAANDPNANRKLKNDALANGAGSGSNSNSAQATETGDSANGQDANKNRQPGYYAGSNLDLDIDGMNLDDDPRFKDGTLSFDALNDIQAREAANKDRIARSFASQNGEYGADGRRKKKNDPSWGDAVHQNPNSSLFKIISRRYRQTAYPLFMQKK